MLLHGGADLLLRDAHGLTALERCQRCGREDVVASIISLGQFAAEQVHRLCLCGVLFVPVERLTPRLQPSMLRLFRLTFFLSSGGRHGYGGHPVCKATMFMPSFAPKAEGLASLARSGTFGAAAGHGNGAAAAVSALKLEVKGDGDGDGDESCLTSISKATTAKAAAAKPATAPRRSLEELALAYVDLARRPPPLLVPPGPVFDVTSRIGQPVKSASRVVAPRYTGRGLDELESPADEMALSTAATVLLRATSTC